MTDFGEQPQPSPQEAHQPSSGVIQRITQPERVGVVPAREPVLGDIVVQAKAKGDKVDLGELAIPSPDVTGGFIVSGGQDAAGAVFYEGGRIDALLVAADGCSFGHESYSVHAARNVVFTSLAQGTDRIARQPNLTRDQISPELEAILLSSHATIQQRFPNGATTAVVAALSQEATPEGQTKPISIMLLVVIPKFKSSAKILEGGLVSGEWFSRPISLIEWSGHKDLNQNQSK